MGIEHSRVPWMCRTCGSASRQARPAIGRLHLLLDASSDLTGTSTVAISMTDSDELRRLLLRVSREQSCSCCTEACQCAGRSPVIGSAAAAATMSRRLLGRRLRGACSCCWAAASAWATLLRRSASSCIEGNWQLHGWYGLLHKWPALRKEIDVFRSLRPHKAEGCHNRMTPALAAREQPLPGAACCTGCLAPQRRSCTSARSNRCLAEAQKRLNINSKHAYKALQHGKLLQRAQLIAVDRPCRRLRGLCSCCMAAGRMGPVCCAAESPLRECAAQAALGRCHGCWSWGVGLQPSTSGRDQLSMSAASA